MSNWDRAVDEMLALRASEAQYKEIAEKAVAALDVALATIKQRDEQIERLIEVGKDAIKLLEKRPK
jgi:hypothetical protein